jgi:hypothetical protein
MITARTLILGSAAGLIALSSGAQAADLPVKAKAVEYVRICSLYGAGFFYIPGTDTCIKLGGYLRADVTFNGGAHGAPGWSGDFGQQNRYRDYFVARSRMALTIDTRTATEYGVVRTFGQGDFQFNNIGNSNPSAVTAAVFPAGIASSYLNTAGGGYVAVEYLFIQFAGFTFGKSASAYATPWQGFPGNLNSSLLGGQNTDTGVNNIQYTAQFGNGVSGSIGLDDPTVWDRTAVYNAALGVSASGTGTNAYAGTHAPDIVGNIRVDQAWGLLQLSAAAHEVSGSYNILGAGGVPTALSEISGHPDTKWGGAVMGALQIKNIPTGAGDDIKLDVSYAKGATKYVIATSGASPNFAMFGGSGNGAYQSVGFGATSDGLYFPGVGGTNGIVLTSAWGIRGAFNHNWNAYWTSSLFGSYSSVRYDGGTNDNINGLGVSTAKGAYCAGFAATHAGQAAVGNAVGNYTCNPDFNVSQLGVTTRWTPVKNLTFSGEVQWFHLDQKMSGSSVFTPSAPKPAALYEFKDQNTVLLQLRAQRNF